MRTVKFIVILLILAQLISGGKVVPALAAGFIAAKPMVTDFWQKQTIISEERIDDIIAAAPSKSQVGAFILPKVKRLINIEKIADAIYRVRQNA
jgi:hypothetical protein